jgi:hypothetical protein
MIILLIFAVAFVIIAIAAKGGRGFSKSSSSDGGFNWFPFWYSGGSDSAHHGSHDSGSLHHSHHDSSHPVSGDGGGSQHGGLDHCGHSGSFDSGGSGGGFDGGGSSGGCDSGGGNQ